MFHVKRGQVPCLTEAQFSRRLLEVHPDCEDRVQVALYAHYLELCRWNPRLSLIGPGTARTVVERHYGESLAAVPLIQTSDRSILDIGSGAGFPGLVLAATLPKIQVTLVESRERKWAFLQAAARRCGLSSQCLNVRVEKPLAKEIPGEIDIVTCRAVNLSSGLFDTLYESFPRARFLLWCGTQVPKLPKSYSVEREIALPGSSRRRILEIKDTRREPVSYS